MARQKEATLSRNDILERTRPEPDKLTTQKRTCLSKSHLVSAFSQKNRDFSEKSILITSFQTYFDDESCSENFSSLVPRILTDDVPVVSPWWTDNLSVPLYCLVFYFLLNFKNDSIFSRLSAFGTLTNVILLAVLIWKAIEWKDFDTISFTDWVL